MQKRWGVVHEPKAFLNVIRNFQRRLIMHAGSGAAGWDTGSPEEYFCDLSRDGVIAMQTNHFLNDQGTRLLEDKPGAITVKDRQLFSDDLRVDWDSYHAHRDLFKLSWRQYKKYLREIRSMLNEREPGVWRRKRLYVSSWATLTGWFLRH